MFRNCFVCFKSIGNFFFHSRMDRFILTNSLLEVGFIFSVTKFRNLLNVFKLFN